MVALAYAAVHRGLARAPLGAPGMQTVTVNCPTCGAYIRADVSDAGARIEYDPTDCNHPGTTSDPAFHCALRSQVLRQLAPATLEF